MRYIIVDWYESNEGDILGIESTEEEADAIVAQRIEDTDGECEVYVYDETDRDMYSTLMERIYG